MPEDPRGGPLSGLLGRMPFSGLLAVAGVVLAGAALATGLVPVSGGVAPDAAALDCPAHYDGGQMAGVSLVSPRSPAGVEGMASLERVATGWVAVLPYGFLGPDDRVAFNRQRQWWGETTDGVAATIARARDLGLKVMLKPHVWAGRAGWVGEYAPDSEEGWERFRKSYTNYILTFAALADSLQVELFVVGTELDRTVRERPELWDRLIDQVEDVYAGALTYAANWDGVQDMPFWDRMDFIGVDAFFPLSSAADPGVDELVDAWGPIVAHLAELCRDHERPLLFTEFGYRSIDGAAGNQWELPPERRRDVSPNAETQVVAYEALFRTWWERPWFAGGFLWKWVPEDGRRADGLRADYTPQHKPAEAVIERWFRQAAEESPGR